MTGRVVPDNLRERGPTGRGRKPNSERSLALLAGKTWFDTEDKNFGSLYTLAKSHGLKCRTKSTILNDEEGFTIWFEEISE